ncbi:hypothetical protein C8R44DRAFT_988121 [Mycena epipterygia]|nr:hypothetical protein C8R44DRAFT_988121 [Mycena epipterygia]
MSLFLTMRDQECPLKILWTRPFIQPLSPLSADAPNKTFIDISDTDNEAGTPHVAELLALTGNLPLAVTLIANAAGDLKGEVDLYMAVGRYYLCLSDIQKTLLHANIALSLTDNADDNFRRSGAFSMLSTCLRTEGNFREPLGFARRAHWLVAQLGHFRQETKALEEEAQACVALGNFSRAIDVCNHMRQLMIATGLEGALVEITARDLEAANYLYKIAYLESRKAHEFTSREIAALPRELAIASIDVVLGVLKYEAEVLAALEILRQIFTSRGYLRGLPVCDKVLADILFATGRTLGAVQMYKKCVRAFRGEAAEFFSQIERNQLVTRYALCDSLSSSDSRPWKKYGKRIYCQFGAPTARAGTMKL